MSRDIKITTRLKFSHLLFPLRLFLSREKRMPLYSAASQSRRSPVRASPSSLSITPHPPFHHHHHYRLYSSPSTYNSRSQFKILPILAIIALSSASYVYLVRSRAASQSPRKAPGPSDR